MEYLYDFGDMWRHDIFVEAISPPEPGVQYPRCVAGAGACPPEDCGGPGGYERLLEVLGDPGHDEYALWMEWTGGGIDPDKFDLDSMNRRLWNWRRPTPFSGG